MQSTKYKVYIVNDVHGIQVELSRELIPTVGREAIGRFLPALQSSAFPTATKPPWDGGACPRPALPLRPLPKLPGARWWAQKTESCA